MTTRFHPEDYARLMDAAERRAHALRREAVAGFWADLAAWSVRLARAALRRLAGAPAQRPTVLEG